MKNERRIRIIASLLLATAFSSDTLYVDDSSFLEFFGTLVFNFLFIFVIWTLIKYLRCAKGWSVAYSFGIPFGVSFLPELFTFLFSSFGEEYLIELLTSSLPSAIVVIGGINLYYQYLLNMKEVKIVERVKRENSFGHMLVNTIKGKSRIEFDELLLVHYTEGKTYLYLSDEQQVTSFDPLSSIAQKLADVPSFFQLNRSVIVKYVAIHKYQTQVDSRIKVLALGKEFLVSKNKAAKFKQWFVSQG